MLRGFVRNIAISAAAFFAVSIVGLLLVPLLIGRYGLEGFGLLALARLFLPVAALAILDFGFGEIATHEVARARATSDWDGCARALTACAVAALAVGMAAAVTLWLLAGPIAGWTSVPPTDHAAFVWLLRCTALALPLLFLSLVAEGVIKGCERFGAQRTIEVASALSNAAIVVLALALSAGFEWAGLALVASLVLRFLLAAAVALRELARLRLAPARWHSEQRRELGQRAIGLWHNKLIGAAQAGAPSLLLGVIVGPIAVGAFDALSRMPRFIKAVLGLLSSTVQPLAARLEAQDDGHNLARLGRLGMLLITGLAAPILGAAVAFAEPTLRLWLGADMAQRWPWQALYFVVPALGAVIGFGGSALLGRTEAVSRINRINLLQLALMIGLGLATVTWLQEHSFIAAQALACVITFPLHMRLVARAMALPGSTWAPLVRIAVASAILAAVTVPLALRIESVPVLLAAVASWVLLCAALCVVPALDARQRRRLREAAAQQWRRRIDP